MSAVAIRVRLAMMLAMAGISAAAAETSDLRVLDCDAPIGLVLVQGGATPAVSLPETRPDAGWISGQRAGDAAFFLTADGTLRVTETSVLAVFSDREVTVTCQDLRATAEAQADLRAETDVLRQSVQALRTQLGRVQGLLTRSQAEAKRCITDFDALGARLNTALAQVAAEQRARAEAAEAACETPRPRR